MGQLPVPLGFSGYRLAVLGGLEFPQERTAPLEASSTAFIGAQSLGVVLVARDGAVLHSSTTTTGALEVLTPSACGRVALQFSTDDFLAARSPLELRFRIVTAGGETIFAPSADPVRVIVRQP